MTLIEIDKQDLIISNARNIDFMTIEELSLLHRKVYNKLVYAKNVKINKKDVKVKDLRQELINAIHNNSILVNE